MDSYKIDWIWSLKFTKSGLYCSNLLLENNDWPKTDHKLLIGLLHDAYQEKLL